MVFLQISEWSASSVKSRFLWWVLILQMCKCPHIKVRTSYKSKKLWEQFLQHSQPSRLFHLCGSIPSESRWIINAHIQFFLLMGKPCEMDFFSWTISCLRCRYYLQILPLEAPGADQDYWHSDVVALTLSRILNTARIDTYSLTPFTLPALTRHAGAQRVTVAAAYIRGWCFLKLLLRANLELMESCPALPFKFHYV